MIFWIVLALAIFSTVMYIVRRRNSSWGEEFGWQLSTIALWACIFFMLLIIFCVHIDAIGVKASYEQTYASLNYQIENDFYTNENEVGKVEFMKQITEWNSMISRGKYNQNNIWYGIFVPDIYNDFELIPLDSLNRGG